MYSMLTVQNISKTYDLGKESETKALKNVSIAFPDKGMVFLLGKSGSGKSTLLHILGGLDKPTSGKLLVDGDDLSEFSASRLDKYRSEYLGFVFQSINLIPELDVYGNVALSLEIQGRKASKQSILSSLKEVELEGLDQRRTNELSGGQKQRVAIARALIKNPRMVLADEPTGSLDSVTGEGIFKLLKRLSKEKLVIVASHDRASALKFGDRIIEFKDGRIEKDSGAMDAPKTSFQEARHSRKSSLPLKVALKIAISNFAKKKFKLGVAIAFSAVSFSLFGVFHSIAALDKNEVISDGLKAAGYSSNAIIKNIKNARSSSYFYDNDGNLDRVVEAEEAIDVPTLFGESDLSYLGSKGVKAAGVFKLPSSISAPYENRLSFEEPTDIYYSLDDDYLFSGFSDCGESFANANFVLEKGRYPEKDDEIAISSFKAESLLTSLDRQGRRAFSSIDKLMDGAISLDLDEDSPLHSLKIVGIYKVNEIPEKYSSLKSFPGYNDKVLKDKFSDFRLNSFLDIAFVSDTFFDASIGKYDRDQPLINGLSLRRTQSIKSLSYDLDSHEMIQGENYDIRAVIPFDFVKSHPGEFELVGLDGERMEPLELKESEAIVSEDYRRFALKGEKEGESLDVYGLEKRIVSKSIGSISSHGSPLPGVLVLSSEGMKRLGFELDDYASITLLSSSYRYDGGGKYNYALSCSLPSYKNVELLNGSHGSYCYLTSDSVSLAVRESIARQYIHGSFFLVGSIAFALLSILSLSSYIGDSVVDKEKQIGILRSMGASLFDTFKIFALETLPIWLVSGTLANVLGAIGLLFVNRLSAVPSVEVNLYSYHLYTALIVFGVSLFFALLSLISPLVKIVRKNAIDAIKTSE